MTKRTSKRKQVRPVERMSIADKRFKRVAPTHLRIGSEKIVHPQVVIADLRRGSLASLDRYVAQKKGIPDRRIALELRKLISGSPCRSPFRLLVIEHPDNNNEGGHPRSPRESTLEKYRSIVDFYEQTLADVGQKKYLARERATAKFKCSESTVKKAIDAVRQMRDLAQDEARDRELRCKRRAEILENRRIALENHRASPKCRSD